MPTLSLNSAIWLPLRLKDLQTLTLKDRNEFMTDMVFIAAKKGDSFGPFGKLY